MKTGNERGRDIVKPMGREMVQSGDAFHVVPPEEGKDFRVRLPTSDLLKSSTRNTCLTLEEDLEQGGSKALLSVGELCTG